MNNLTEDIIQMAMKLPMDKLKQLDQILHEKNTHVRNQEFEKAVVSRDKEKKLQVELGIPTSVNYNNLYSTIRERKIDELLDGN